jgi:hypothetical protein
VEDPLVAFFFWLNQAKGPKVEEVTLDETNLLLGHPAALQVKGKTGKV